MSTIQELVGKYNELDVTKGRELAFPIAVEIHRLNYKWLKEFNPNNLMLLDRLDLFEKSTAIPSDGESLTKYISDSQKKISDEIKVIKKLNTAQREQCASDHRRAILSLYIEVFNSDELSTPNKIIIGNCVKNAFQTCLDLNDNLSEKYSEVVKIISRRVSELESPNFSSHLYYWPDTAPPFDEVMEELKNEKFIEDSSFALDVFKRFDPPLERIQWLRNRRLLIYFLLLLYGSKGHNGETNTEIGYKLFDFSLRETNPKYFTTEAGVVDELLKSNYQLSAKYLTLKRILKVR